MMDSTSVPLISPRKSSSELSVIRLILITCLQLGLNVVQDACAVITLPYEIKELFPERPALTLGIIVAIASTFMMTSPIVGFYSDRCTSSWGRRRPFIAGGSLLTLIAVIGCWLSSSSTFALKYPYVISFIVVQVGVVVSTAGFTALIADVVPVSQRGLASGLFGVMGILGSAIGYAAVGAALPVEKTSMSYLVLIVVVILSTGISLAASRETPLSYHQRLKLETETPDIRSCVKQMLGGLKHKDFALVLLGRVFYFICLAPEAFLLYLTQDLTPAENPELAVTILVLTAEVTALFMTIPSGKLSDRYGRKIFVYIGTLLIIVTFQLFVMTSSMVVYYSLGIIYGVGNGMYFTVEMALGMDCLPPEEESTPQSEDDQHSQSGAAGRNMGLWGTAQSVGSLLGLYMFSPLLQFIGSTDDKDHYTRTGYIVIFTIGSTFAALSALMVFLIKTNKKKAATSINH